MIPSGRYGVALVVDPAFGVRLVDLAARLPVWVCDSAENLRAVHAILTGHPRGATPPEITTFRWNGDADAAVVNILGTLDLHHGEFSRDPPWSILEVYGATQTDAVERALAPYGVTRIQAFDGGFIAFTDA